MRLKTSLNFRGYPNRNEIVYYDGEERVIEVNEFEKLWSLLKILESPKEDVHTKIQEWKNNNDIEDEELHQILQFINENGMLYEKRCDKMDEEQLYNIRNFHYFSTHDSTIYADAIVQRIKKVKAVVIGAGTIGATLCMTLSKLGVGEIIVIDFDTVQLKNIRAQTIFQKEDTNKKKIHVIQEKLKKMDPYVKVQVYDMKIETIHDLLRVDLHDVHYIFGCFDESSLQLQKDIMNYCDKEKIQYYLMGYHNDFVKVFHVSNRNDGERLLEESFQNYHTEYVIRENRGTIIQSLAVSLIISRILFEDITKSSCTVPSGYHFDFITFQTSHNRQSISREPFVQSLQRIMPFDQEQLNRKIEFLFNIIDKKEKVTILPKVIEMDILSMHQVFDILFHIGQIASLQLEDHYNKFIELMNEIDKTEDPEHNEDEYEQYLQFIRSMKINYEDEVYTIFEIFEMIRNTKDYEEKKKMQSGIYEVLKQNGDTLLSFFVNSKKKYLALEIPNYYMEVFGVKEETLHILENELQKKFHTLLTKSLSMMFSNSFHEIGVDFLSYNEEEHSMITLDEAKHFIVTSLEKDGKHHFVHYIERMFEENFIQVYNNVEVNKTYYFPSMKESRIVFNYHNDMDSVFVLCHELGHAYFNQSYGHTFFDDSTQLVNEMMAYYFEIICIQSMLGNEEIKIEMKQEIARQYIKRIHQTVLSTYGVHLLEKSLVKHIEEHGTISLLDFLKIRDEYNQHSFFKGIKFKNEKYFYLNPLLKSSFMLEFGEHLLPPMAYLLAVSLYNDRSETSIPKDIRMQEAIYNGVYCTEEFLSYVAKDVPHDERMKQAIHTLLELFCKLESFTMKDEVYSN
ncbi:ThiF family adenylyltransferase [Bacillus cytotoxicus]|uniref:ThiF family adenylyltransferase n=1 Tax=Bacillus cytotoxicus TaxID=580165 RepID=UPI0024469944|nr:ThiF family adenylyltransferase [Bacillus cytotoxicus]MDH2880576.1 ThiF family adenylyltransferase [Bacillus cytotoxicus]